MEDMRDVEGKITEVFGVESKYMGDGSTYMYVEEVVVEFVKSLCKYGENFGSPRALRNCRDSGYVGRI